MVYSFLPIFKDYGVYGFIDGSYTCPEPTMGDEDGSSVQNPAFQQGQIDSVILLWMQDMILRQIRQEIILIKSKRGHTVCEAWLKIEQLINHQVRYQILQLEVRSIAHILLFAKSI